MEDWILKRSYLNYKEIISDFSLDEISAQLISKKQFKTKLEIYNYLDPDFSLLHDPFKLKGMEEAVNSIIDDIKNNKKILISLDYDVDGIISGAIAFTGLTQIGANCSYILPHRVTDGYGINERIIEYAKEKSIDTIITFDNGIAAFDAINLAKSYGIKVIVTDHHDIPFDFDENQKKIFKYVNADIIVNPKQHDCKYPFKGICGGEIAYKLIYAIYSRSNEDLNKTRDFLSLAAIATICDVMELKDENRAFVSLGLKHIHNMNNPGLKELLLLYNINGQVTPDDIGFKIGPCFNSSGRLSTAAKSLELLTAAHQIDISDPNHTKKLAEELFELNKTRKEITFEAFEKAILIIESELLYTEDIILVYIEDIHESIAGIVASRIKEKYNRPTIVFTNSEDLIKGSARSIESVDIFELISNHKDMLLKFGGHPMAAGMSLEKENLFEFFSNLKTTISKYLIPKNKVYKVDMVLKFEQLDLSLAMDLKKFEPYGKGNEKILFSSLKVTLKSFKIIGKNSNVLRINISQAGIFKEFICFSDIDSILLTIKNKVQINQYDDIIVDENNTFDIIYTIGTNIFNGYEKLQLELISIR